MLAPGEVLNTENSSNHQTIMSSSIVLVPLLALVTIGLISILWSDGAFSFNHLFDLQLIIIHSIIIGGLFIGYYLIVEKARRAIKALEQTNKETLSKLEEKTSLFHLEAYQHRKTSDELHNLKTIDPLTQVHNQNYFQELLANEIERKKRYDSDFSLLIIELDNLVPLNTTYGYKCGDFAMKTFAQFISSKLRKTDLLARYNEHNFAIIAPSTRTESAKQLARRLCHDAEVSNVYYGGVPLKITLSIGIGEASAINELTVENLTLATERALTDAVDQGRNRAVNV